MMYPVGLLIFYPVAIMGIIALSDWIKDIRKVFEFRREMREWERDISRVD